MAGKYSLTILCLSLFLTACGGSSDSGIVSAVHAAETQNIHKAFVNQVGPIPDTVMATPTTDGDYRMVVYLTAGAGTITNEIDVNTVWTDTRGTFIEPASWQQTSAPSAQHRVLMFAFHAVAGQPIKITGDGTTNTTFQYDCFVTLEQL